MNRYIQLEHSRLSTDVAMLQQRLVLHRPGIGLRARSVHTFLNQLYRYKQDMLKELDVRMAREQSSSERVLN